MNPTLQLIEASRQQDAAHAELEAREKARIHAIKIETMKPIMAMWDDVKGLPARNWRHGCSTVVLMADHLQFNPPSGIALHFKAWNGETGLSLKTASDNPNQLVKAYSGRADQPLTLEQAKAEFVGYLKRQLIGSTAQNPPRTEVAIHATFRLRVSMPADTPLDVLAVDNFRISAACTIPGITILASTTTGITPIPIIDEPA